MANICDFEIRFKGTKENCEKLLGWLSSSYDYTDKENPKCYLVNGGVEVPTEHHIGYRVFQAELRDSCENDDGSFTYDVNGSCAWSVNTCMFNRKYTYMGDTTLGYDGCYPISITDVSKQLGLDIEIFSKESGVGFCEHYFISGGEIKVDEEGDYTIDFIEDSDDYTEKCDYMDDLCEEFLWEFL